MKFFPGSTFLDQSWSRHLVDDEKVEKISVFVGAVNFSQAKESSHSVSAASSVAHTVAHSKVLALFRQEQTIRAGRN